MVSTRSNNVKYTKKTTKKNNLVVNDNSDYSSDNDSDLEYINDDIDKYKSDSDSEYNPGSESESDSDSELKITHSNNINISNKISNKSIKRKPNTVTNDINNKRTRIDSNFENSYSPIETSIYNQLVSGIAEKMTDDTIEIQKNKESERDNKWKKSLTKREIKKYDNEYKLISEKIKIAPTINDILQTNMPFNVKCELMEKIIILDNVQSDTFDHLNITKDILETIDKYKKFDLDAVSYIKYEKIEKELNDAVSDDIPLNFKILKSNMPYKNKIAVYNAHKYYKTLVDTSSESSKLLNWIESILKLPTELLPLNISLDNKLNYKTNTISKFLSDVNYSMNNEIYGMTNVKEQILCILNNKITNPKLIGSSIGLSGPQGVGKTQIIKVLSNAIKLPFESISLGGMSDSDHLLGHGYTYEGSRCGAITESLMNMKYLNGILFFDEIDKISTTKAGDEITKALIHITDFTQNNEFCDKYLGNSIKIDLSNLWFIYSLNYKELIDKTLLDRLTIIDVSGYTINEKKEMAIKYLIPTVLKNIGLSEKNCISFSDESLLLMINKTNDMYDETTKDKDGKSGVRKLKDCISDIITKLNYLKSIIQEDGTYGDLKPSFAIKDFKLPYVVKEKDIETLNIFTKNIETDNTYSMYI